VWVFPTRPFVLINRMCASLVIYITDLTGVSRIARTKLGTMVCVALQGFLQHASFPAQGPTSRGQRMNRLRKIACLSGSRPFTHGSSTGSLILECITWNNHGFDDAFQAFLTSRSPSSAIDDRPLNYTKSEQIYDWNSIDQASLPGSSQISHAFATNVYSGTSLPMSTSAR